MFLEYKDLSSREAYEFYRENRKKVSKNIDQYNYFKKAVEGLILLLRDMIIENEEGVCIKDLGYFCLIRRKDKSLVRNIKTKSILKRYIKKYQYVPFLFTDIMYDNWHMENAFLRDMQKKINRQHKDYKIRKILCDGSIVNEDFLERMQRNRWNKARNDNYKKEARK